MPEDIKRAHIVECTRQGASLLLRRVSAALAASLLVLSTLVPALGARTPAADPNRAEPAIRSNAVRVVELSRSVDRAAIENLQRWVNDGHEAWCRDARLVASAEIQRIAPAFGVASFENVALPLEAGSARRSRQTFSWTTPDGEITYTVTVERFTWLLPLAGSENRIVWVPVQTRI